MIEYSLAESQRMLTEAAFREQEQAEREARERTEAVDKLLTGLVEVHLAAHPRAGTEELVAILMVGRLKGWDVDFVRLWVSQYFRAQEKAHDAAIARMAECMAERRGEAPAAASATVRALLAGPAPAIPAAKRGDRVAVRDAGDGPHLVVFRRREVIAAVPLSVERADALAIELIAAASEGGPS